MSRRVALISGHQKNWNAGASTVFLHLDRELATAGWESQLFHASDYAGRPSAIQKLVQARRLARKLSGVVADRDVVEVAGNLGWSLFRAIKRSPGPERPLCVTRIHGLEFKDEQAFFEQEIACQIRLPAKYKLLTRHFVNWQERQTLAAADVVVCHSSREVDAIVAAGWKDAGDVELMPLGVDERFFGERAYAGAGNRLIWWGSWVERKGISSLPRAFELACRDRPDLTLTIGGAGTPTEAVLSAFPVALRPRVRVLPFVAADAHLDALRSHDVFLFPSLSEGFGLALLEAMATGLPAIATHTGLAHDWLEHGDNCLIVPMSGPTALARAILRLVASESLRQKLGSGAQRTAGQLTWGALGRRTAAVYEERLATLRGPMAMRDRAGVGVA